MNTSTTELEKINDTAFQELTGSQAVLEACIAEGVDTIFGYPGGAIMPIYDALYDYNEKLKHILVCYQSNIFYLLFVNIFQHHVLLSDSLKLSYSHR